jgi:hypothetical protein
MSMSAQPVFSSVYRIFSQVLPPSVVLYRPRSGLSLQSGAGYGHIHRVRSVGWMMILEMCSLFSRPCGSSCARRRWSGKCPVRYGYAVAHVAFAGAHPNVSGLAWSMAMAPMDCGYFSNRGSKVMPAVVDFHTPPPAVPDVKGTFGSVVHAFDGGDAARSSRQARCCGLRFAPKVAEESRDWA